MEMKEKQPITPVTPVPTPSVAIEAEANREGPSTTKPDFAKGSDMPLDGADKLPNLSMSQLDNIQDTSDEYIDPAREPKMQAGRRVPKRRRARLPTRAA